MIYLVHKGVYHPQYAAVSSEEGELVDVERFTDVLVESGAEPTFDSEKDAQLLANLFGEEVTLVRLGRGFEEKERKVFEPEG